MHRSRLIAAVLLLSACQKLPSPLPQPSPTPPVPVPTPAPVYSPTPNPVVEKQGWVEIQAARWGKATIRPEKLHFVQAIAAKIERSQPRYQAVSKQTGVPWEVIGCLHSLEADLDFRCNLANGDPLTARTRHVPSGRPPTGNPPFSWESAAADALEYDRMNRKNWSDMGNTLQNTELYNGPYYEKHGLVSPYNHSWDTLYVRGKIVADGVYSSTAVSQQCGVVPILKILENNR